MTQPVRRYGFMVVVEIDQRREGQYPSKRELERELRNSVKMFPRTKAFVREIKK